VKKSTLKIIVFVILPALILLGIGIYFIFQLPQVRFGLQKTLLNYMIERSIRQGKLSQERGIQLKAAFNRFYAVVAKLPKSGIDKQTINNEIVKLVIKKQINPNFGIPNFLILTELSHDEEVNKLITFFNELSDRFEELLKH
jgi:hypothetical protein